MNLNLLRSSFNVRVIEQEGSGNGLGSLIDLILQIRTFGDLRFFPLPGRSQCQHPVIVGGPILGIDFKGAVQRSKCGIKIAVQIVNSAQLPPGGSILITSAPSSENKRPVTALVRRGPISRILNPLSSSVSVAFAVVIDLHQLI